MEASDFNTFFAALHGYEPFPWQSRAAKLAIDGSWPEAMSLPTASGKTACIDIALFALALQAGKEPSQRTAPLRILFVVNRRVIVDEAYERSRFICQRLAEAETDPNEPNILKQAAQNLRRLAGEHAPCPVSPHLLRGGVFRDESWMHDASQPKILCCTVDMAGSRLLFDGYGLSPRTKPIAAGLLGQDSLWILDESHLNRAFVETLTRVNRYAAHAEADHVRPPQVVEMTATPPPGKSGFSLDSADLEHPILKQRSSARKPTTLIHCKGAKGKGWQGKLAKAMIEHCLIDLQEFQSASDSDSEHPPSIGILCNRVATARSVEELLSPALKKAKLPAMEIELVIGRMRPIDRDQLTNRLQTELGLKSGSENRPGCIVVSTQCLEAGADMDFDILVTELASLDALRQRFGRLNRMGRTIPTRATIIAPEELLNPKKPDPIYGNAAAATWEWMRGHATPSEPNDETDPVTDFGSLDFGLSAMADKTRTLPAEVFPDATHAAILLPTHLDLLSQTQPRPIAVPDIDPFLHGAREARADISVVWRGDLNLAPPEDWSALVSAMPPRSAEAVQVPFYELNALLESNGKAKVEDGGDAPLNTEPAHKYTPDKDDAAEPFLVRQPDGFLLEHDTRVLRPGMLVVLRSGFIASQVLAKVQRVPSEPKDKTTQTEATSSGEILDVAEAATLEATARITLRLNPYLPWYAPLKELASQETGPSPDQLREVLTQQQQHLPDHIRSHIDTISRWRRVPVEGVPSAWVIEATHRLPNQVAHEPRNEAENLIQEDGIYLDVHNQAVSDEVSHIASRLGIPQAVAQALAEAGRAHDLGKADLRFQALLRGGNPWATHTRALAKSSGQLPATPADRNLQREKSGLPKGFRHELLSVRLLEAAGVSDDLILHLVASHHGFCRGLASSIADPHPILVKSEWNGTPMQISSDTKLDAIGSGIAARFWSCQRTHGWWGLAYLEALLRLSDWRVSRLASNPTVTTIPRSKKVS